MSETFAYNSPVTCKEDSGNSPLVFAQPEKVTYNKVLNSQKINILYEKEVHGTTNAEIAEWNNINYNTTRKIVCIYNKEEAKRNKTR